MYQNKMLTTAALICVCSAFIFFELSVGESDQRMFFIGWNWKMNGNKNVIDVIINDLNEHSIKPETGKSIGCGYTGPHRHHRVYTLGSIKVAKA